MWVVIGLLSLGYLFIRVLGADRRLTLGLSWPAIVAILVLSVIGAALLLYDFFCEEASGSNSSARLQAQQKFPTIWPVVGIPAACAMGAAGFALTYEIAKIAAPYVAGLDAVKPATIIRSGDGEKLYGRTQWLDHCVMYVDLTLHNDSSHRLCLRPTIDCYRVKRFACRPGQISLAPMSFIY